MIAEPEVPSVSEHVRPRFSRSAAVLCLHDWRADSHKQAVWHPVRSHQTRVLDALELSDVLAVCRRIAASEKSTAWATYGKTPSSRLR